MTAYSLSQCFEPARIQQGLNPVEPALYSVYDRRRPRGRMANAFKLFNQLDQCAEQQGLLLRKNYCFFQSPTQVGIAWLHTRVVPHPKTVTDPFTITGPDVEQLRRSRPTRCHTATVFHLAHYRILSVTIIRNILVSLAGNQSGRSHAKRQKFLF